MAIRQICFSDGTPTHITQYRIHDMQHGKMLLYQCTPNQNNYFHQNLIPNSRASNFYRYYLQLQTFHVILYSCVEHMLYGAMAKL